MGVPTSEVGYTSAMPRREDHEVYKDMWGAWGEKKRRGKILEKECKFPFTLEILREIIIKTGHQSCTSGSF